MPSLRTIRRRITSTKGIQKITKAMQTVAAVRLRRAQDRLLSSRPYARKIDEVLKHLAVQTEGHSHPLLMPREEIRVRALLVVTADRGFCGSFNANVIRRATKESRETLPAPGLVCVGRKGSETLRRQRVTILNDYINVFQSLEYEQAVEIANYLMELYVGGQVDRVDVLYNEFKSVGQQSMVMDQLLPVPPLPLETDPHFSGYVYEPEQNALLGDLIPQHIRFQIWRVLLESNAAEEAARMLAMDNATRNASDLIDELTLTANKVRQATITSELMDIVGGAEALK
ncbi:MAG: ATP synthase F1 subunit gamma [candidate division Zixibacteria bacterium]|nr:ATP synthase F1 subunit gamma [candidate division Zixibacteria bacterium]